jgi:hypothetical protein
VLNTSIRFRPLGVPQPDTASYPGPALKPPIVAVLLSPEVTSVQPAAPTVLPPPGTA